MTTYLKVILQVSTFYYALKGTATLKASEFNVQALVTSITCNLLQTDQNRFKNKKEGGSHMRQRMNFHLVLHGEYFWPINYKNVFIYFKRDF